MEESRNFDLLNSPLEKANLIEASAGTGKTYAIMGIFLRLLLEKRFSIGEILAVTFTVAATEELRDRIRRHIRAAIDAFTTGEHNDPFLDGLVKNSSNHREAFRILRAALRDFDEAPIYTIHGFCQRVLHESAFESMGLFDTELVPDERALKEEIVQDFWRRHFYEAPSEFVSYALSKSYKPQLFLNLTRGRLSDPDMRIIPEALPVSLDSLESFRKARDRVRSAWWSVRDDILIKLNDPGLNRNQYRNPEFLAATMDGYVDSKASLPLFKGFDKFTSSRLTAGTNRGNTTPGHPFFDACERLKNSADNLESQIEGHLLFLKVDIFRYMREELDKRKQKRNVQSYDDLLINLRNALDRSGGKKLAGELRKRYRAALIDEFQDTDPIQYAIFQNIFGGEESILFFIGDPKQSIYSFRGADLFAYMRASRHVDYRYTLTSNWRSEPDLVRAVNAIFANPEKKAFLYEEVPFERAVAGDVSDRSYLTIDGRSEPPFQIWLLKGDRLEMAGAKTNQSVTVNLIVRAVAAEISRLLSQGREKKAMIGAEPLVEGHIAVLVRENREARLVQESLRNLNIHSVLHSTGNLFDTHEALEMERVLAGIAEPHSESLIRIALTTDILGLNGEGLEALRQNEADWEKWVTRFREYNNFWERYGFIGMFPFFLSRERIRERLLAFPDGERRLTNILHLTEVLHTESVERKLGIAGMIKWLACQRDPDALRSDEHELRLESDDRAVRIVTIHKSKGLEYPVVFCPFNWGDSKAGKKEFTYHDPEDNWRLNLILDPDRSTDKPLAERENLAENIRLLYVSLTRAKNRCYLLWGLLKDAGTSSLAYILHPPGDDVTDIVSATESHFLNLSDNDMQQVLESIASGSGGAISVCEMPAPSALACESYVERTDGFSCRTFPGITDRDKRIASFSYLLSERAALAGIPTVDLSELPDRDGGMIFAEMPYQKEPIGMFAFPKGAKAGNLLHDILEHVDFTNPDGAETKSLVAEKLKLHGFDFDWQETVCRMIGHVVTVPLHPAMNGLKLSAVRKEERLSELEFYFPLNRLTPDRLQKIFVESGVPVHPAFPERIGRLNFHPVSGFMKGFMDLVFYHKGRFFLVDWKSNFLGASIEDYRAEALPEVMQEEFYILQYHLYALALHQYLKMRIPHYDYETHFGGVFYIFLRGVDPTIGSNTGIYRERPDRESIEFLCRSLIKGQTCNQQP
jgi:exodeoxyribonuclease V beta subunit